ncbi:MAG: glycosyltransferase family protein [Candidatus Altiarchaeota archaeon]
MRVLIFMCGEGLGHTSRCISVGRQLISAGNEVFFGAYGYSHQLVEKSGYSVHEIPSEIKLVGRKGYLDMLASVGATLKSAKLSGGKVVLDLIDEVKPDVVLSDSYYLGILGAKVKGIPVVIMVNQTNMVDFFRDRGTSLNILGKLAKTFYSAVFEQVDGIIVPDFPPPYTVCRRNLSFTKGMLDKIVFSGPIVRRRYGEVKAKKLAKPHVLSMVGGFGYRACLFENILAAAKLDRTIDYTLVSGPSVDAAQFGRPHGNVGIESFIEDPFPYIKGSDVVIAPGGHSGCMESMSFGKPLLSFPDMLHNEQENNATVVDEEGYGRRLSYFTPPQVILTCIREVLDDKSYVRKTARLRRLSAELDGPSRVVEILEDAA